LHLFAPFNSETQMTSGTGDAGNGSNPHANALAAGPLPRPAVFTEAARRPISVIDGREQPFQESVDCLTIDPANHGHEIVLRIMLVQLPMWAKAVAGALGQRFRSVSRNQFMHP
jgi:hypothetical protein